MDDSIPSLSDQEVIDRIKEGHPDEGLAFKFLYQKYKESFIRIMRAQYGRLTIEDAEDAFQEAICLFDKKVKEDSFRLTHSVRPYLKKIMENKCFESTRGISKPRVFHKSDVSEAFPHILGKQSDFIQKLLGKDKLQDVNSVMSSMSPICIRILKLAQNDIKLEVVAYRMGYDSTKVVATTLSRCRKKLRERMRNFYFNNTRYA